MSDHDFEQKVRQKLADLKLTPSPAAWEKIESGLRDNRRPRTRFVWAALLLFMTGGGYLAYQFTGSVDPEHAAIAPVKEIAGTTLAAEATTKATTTTAPEAATPNEAAVAIKAATPNEAAVTREVVTATETAIAPEAATPNEAAVTPEAIKAAQVTTPTEAAVTAIETPPPTKTPSHVSGSLKTPPTASAPASADTDRSDRTAADLTQHPDGARPEMAKPYKTGTGNTPEEQDPVALNNRDQERKTAPGAVPDNGHESPVAKAPSGLTDNAAVPEPLPSKSGANRKSLKKWSFAVTAFSGVNAVKEGIKLFDLRASTLVQNVAERPQFSAPMGWAPNVDNAIPNAVPNYRPSPITPAFTYAVGAEAKRQLGDRISLSAGLRYLQLNTHSKVGRQEYASQIVNNGSGYLWVSSYFRVEPEQTAYRNRYHFIDVPVEMQLRLGRGTSLPVYWNAGLTVSQLLGSNALHFDGSTGVYYQDDNLLNRTQFAMSTGFSIGLLNKTATPLVVGPTVRYHISEVLRKEVSGSQHFGSLGLQLKVFIK